ncbi:hypothetical protein ABPG74_001544 [Tetrahymena malaccensis]
MSQLADQLDNFPYLPIVSAISDLQKITIYYEKFNELYNSQKINKMKVHNLNLDVNMYQKDTCFLVQNQTGFGLEDTLLKLKGKPKQMKKKLKSIGPFFYVDGEFEFDKSMMIAALKIKKGIQKEQSFQKYKHLQGFTFVHIFEMSQKKKKRSRTAQQVMHNNKQNQSQSLFNSQELDFNENINQINQEQLSQSYKVDINYYENFQDNFQNKILQINLDYNNYQIQFETLFNQIN